jgi:hypothetical protein
MGVKKVMIIRHAEKPGKPPYANYSGVNYLGQQDSCSLIPRGWQRGGGIANLFCPTNDQFQSPLLTSPDIIFAASPGDLNAICPPPSNSVKGDGGDDPSKRPYETVMALNAKLNLTQFCFNYLYESQNFAEMVQFVLAIGVEYSNVLISWQHQLILPATLASDCIVNELLTQTGTSGSLVYEAGASSYSWPGDRYDMVLVFDRPTGSGPFTSFTQVPQMLLDGDITQPFPNIYPQNTI